MGNSSAYLTAKKERKIIISCHVDFFGGGVGTICRRGIAERGVWTYVYVQCGVFGSVEVGAGEQDAQPLRNVYSLVARLRNSSLPPSSDFFALVSDISHKGTTREMWRPRLWGKLKEGADG